MKLILKLIKNPNISNLQKEGFNKIESCNPTNVKESSMNYLDDLWEKVGYNRLIPHYGDGCESKLKEEEIAKLKNILKTEEILL